MGYLLTLNFDMNRYFFESERYTRDSDMYAASFQKEFKLLREENQLKESLQRIDTKETKTLMLLSEIARKSLQVLYFEFLDHFSILFILLT